MNLPADISREFRHQLTSVAEANGLTPEHVYDLWRKYCRDCSSYDQSAIWSEFLSWYRKDLPTLPAGMTRLG